MTVDPTAIIKAAETVSKNDAIGHSLSDVWNALLGDRIANYRLRQAAKLQEKTIAEFDRLGLKPNIDKIPERFALTWFEEATKQDEPEIQELFARLIAKAAAGDEDALDRRNIELVSKLTPHDAIVFQEFASGGWGANVTKGIMHWNDNKIYYPRENSKVNVSQLTRSLEHLINIGLFGRIALGENQTSKSLSGSNVTRTSVINTMILTEAGKSVFNAIKVED